ncbi:hypothetical protein RHGRI_012093 [Rhododendron griersonianum]|uniref:Jacalin-type lectin domain-containing protein n=1 Tax=Rhododendron griersonianum TaxID=479676 RepID=A0AAV6KP84_9ERIC|nr:hypothetical protein RHGRI_012093 [Rhododendron griersonianum]
MFKIGPVGNASSGSPWDELDRVGIAQIFISHGDMIHSLQFQFVENGTLVLSDKHGLDCGYDAAPKFKAIKLRYPSELIIGICGSYGIRSGQQIVSSISFCTNLAAYGPFGCRGQEDIAFDYQVGLHNKFCGFHGAASMYLNSIGVYMEPMTTRAGPGC